MVLELANFEFFVFVWFQFLCETREIKTISALIQIYLTPGEIFDTGTACGDSDKYRVYTRGEITNNKRRDNK